MQLITGNQPHGWHTSCAHEFEENFKMTFPKKRSRQQMRDGRTLENSIIPDMEVPRDDTLEAKEWNW